MVIEGRITRNLLLVTALFWLALSFRLWDIGATGGTWDEAYFFEAGKVYIQNILSRNFGSHAWKVDYQHPPIAEYAYGAVNYFVKAKAHDYTPSRVISAVMGALTCLVVYFAGKEFFGRRVGVVAALILAFMPQFVAHNKVAALESPVALFSSLTVYFLLQGVKRRSNSKYLISAIFCGLTIGTRFDGFLLFILVFLVFLSYCGAEVFRKEVVGLPTGLLLFPLLAMAVFVGSWPWLWSDTFRHLAASLTHWGPSPTEYLLGRPVRGPLSYYILYFLGTTPALVLTLCGVFTYKAVKDRNFYLSALTLWFGVFFLFSFSHWKQDGIRYIYQIYPPLSLISAIGLFSIADAFSWSRYRRLISHLLSSTVIVYLAVTCWIIHPYYLDYYNEIVGGPRNVYERKWFDVGWWGEGIKEAVHYVNENATPNSWIWLKVYPRHEIPPLNTFLRVYPIWKDDFAIKWKGKLKVDHDGNYTFYTQSDDGARLWVDNQLIISDWRDHALTENKGSIVLTKGTHDVELHFYENQALATIRLLWSSDYFPKSVIPSEQLYYAFGPYKGNGLWGQYYNRRFHDFIMNRVDTTIDFEWGLGAPADAQIDYVVVNTYAEWYRDGPFRSDDFEKVYTVDAAGAPLVTVYRRTKEE